MICEITIAVFATLVLADAGNTPGFYPDAGAPDAARQADWVRKLLLFVLGAAGVLAAWEILMRFREGSTDSGLPLVILPSQNVNRPVARMYQRPTAFGSSPSGSPAPPDYSAPREIVSVSAPPEGTMLLLPGRFEIVKGDSRMKDIRFVKVPGIDVVTFGRHPGETDMHVRVDSPTVSRMHASMRYADGRWLVQNLSKTNPVVLNGEQLSVGGSEQALHDGDQLEIGEVTFRYRSH